VARIRLDSSAAASAIGGASDLSLVCDAPSFQPLYGGTLIATRCKEYPSP